MGGLKEKISKYLLVGLDTADRNLKKIKEIEVLILDDFI